MRNSPLNIDLSGFWDDSDYANQEYVDVPLTDELLASIEAELGYFLPPSYVELMRNQNGGIPNNCSYPTVEPTSWADDHVSISGIMSIGRERTYSLCGPNGSQFMIDEWGYPKIGVCICNCPSGGHDMIMLDYRDLDGDEEPKIVHVAQEHDYRITHLAPNFATFVSGLVHDSTYDLPEEDYVAPVKVSLSPKLREAIEKARKENNSE